VLGLEGRLKHLEASDHLGTCSAGRAPCPARGDFAYTLLCSGLMCGPTSARITPGRLETVPCLLAYGN